MKTVYIARHAKSSWEYPSIKDIDRTLTANGIKAAYGVASRLKEEGNQLDSIISSPANRAIHTALIHSRVMDLPSNRIIINAALYYENETSIIDLLKQQFNEVNHSMIVGHNPTFTNLANHFLENRLENIQTSGIIQLSFKTEDWAEINPKNLTHSLYFKRKEIVDLRYAQ